MSALICGSFAYDTIMVFHDRFKNHILPDKVHMLSVAFLVPQLRREFGGCAGNIAYNLKLLGGDPLPMATVGKDFGPLLRVDGRMRDRARARDPDRDRVHRPGVHHHRPRRQPDHRVPSGGDELRASQRRTRGVRCGDRDRRAGRARGDDRARLAIRRTRHPRSSSTPGRGCRCSTATTCAASSTLRRG